MHKSFRLWLEEKSEKRDIWRKLLKNLDFSYDDDSLADFEGIKLRRINKEKLKSALSTMGLDQDKLENILNNLKTMPDSTLKELIAQISELDLPEQETEMPTRQAEVPQSHHHQQKPPQELNL